MTRARLLTAICLLLVSAPSAQSQVEVPQRVVASGGKSMGSANYGVRATLGQAVTGAPSSPSFRAALGYWYLPFGVATSIRDTPSVPKVFSIDQNYPNPFNPTTTIRFALPRDSRVRLRAFDVSGKLVALLVDEVRPAGIHQAVFDASSLSSGTYFYRIEADGFMATRKLVLVK